jgi:hypothetical protein
MSACDSHEVRWLVSCEVTEDIVKRLHTREHEESGTALCAKYLRFRIENAFCPFLDIDEH